MNKHELLERYNNGERDFREYNFKKIDLSRTNLEGANFEGANFKETNFFEANLKKSNLRNSCLEETNFEGAILTGTCLDPLAKIQKITNKEIISADLIIEGDFIIGYRTEHSIFHGKTKYIPGGCYSSKYFSVDKNTKFHPGLYFSNYNISKYLSAAPSNIIRVASRRDETVHASKQWRAKRLLVLPFED